MWNPAAGESVDSDRGSVAVPSAEKDQRWRLHAIWAVVLISISVFAGYLVATRRYAATIDGGLVVAEEQLNFGRVVEQTDLRWTLDLQNTSDSDIEIAGFEPSCGSCTLISPESLIVPANGRERIVLTLDLTQQRFGNPESPSRDFCVAVNPLIRGRVPNRISGWRWTLCGRVVTPFNFVPPRPAFAEGSLVSGEQFCDMHIEVTAREPVAELTVDTDPSLCEVSLVAVADREGIFRVCVTPHAGLAVGRHEAVLRFSGKLRDGTHIQDLPLRVSIPVVDDIQIEPATVILGAVALGETASEVVTLVSRSGRAFTVRDFHSSSAALTIEALETGSEAVGRRYRILVRPDRAASDFAQVHFRVDGDDQKPRILSAPVIWQGLDSRRVAGGNIASP